MTRLTPLALFVALAASGCGSSSSPVTAAVPSAGAGVAVAEAQRAVDRAAVDSTLAPYLDGPRADARRAAGLLAAGETAEATHRAALARRGVRLAELQAEVDVAERDVQDAEAVGGQRLLVTDAFDTARVTLRPGPRAAVDTVAAYLLSHPGRVVLVESYTDASGSDERNLDLSVRRAEAVKARMVEAGVAADRVVTAGYGEEYPVASNDTAEGRRQNRRIEITVADAVAALPTR